MATVKMPGACSRSCTHSMLCGWFTPILTQIAVIGTPLFLCGIGGRGMWRIALAGAIQDRTPAGGLGRDHNNRPVPLNKTPPVPPPFALVSLSNGHSLQS